MKRRVLLGVTGSIAAYKAAELARLFIKAGVEVECMMTKSATEFLTPTTLATLTERPVTVGLFASPEGASATYETSAPSSQAPASPSSAQFLGTAPLQDDRDHDPAPSREGSPTTDGAPLDWTGTTSSTIGHIQASRSVDLIVVAPVTANLLGKVASGIADDALTTTLLASSAPTLFAPAMNTLMWNHPAVQENVAKLSSWGYHFADPDSGELACGEYGTGRMAEPEAIADRALRLMSERRSIGSLLVTTGGTEEAVDPVRVLGNRSSGRMGYAVAEAGRNLGYRVTVIEGRTTAPPPYGVERVPATTAKDMAAEVSRRHRDHDILVMAAAVADYRPAKVSSEKIRSGSASMSLQLTPTTDVLKSVASKRRDQVTVGFALQTGGTKAKRVEAGQEKLRRKGVDFLVLNDPTQHGSRFGGETNEVSFLFSDDRREDLPQQTKLEIGYEILNRAAAIRAAKSDESSSLDGNPGPAPRKKVASRKVASRKVANRKVANRKIANKKVANKKAPQEKAARKKPNARVAKVNRKARRRGGAE